MEEKYGAIWITIEEDASATIVSEKYLPEIEKVHCIFRQASGFYVPHSYVKKRDPQYSLPIWTRENDKALMPTIDAANDYLRSYAQRNT